MLGLGSGPAGCLQRARLFTGIRGCTHGNDQRILFFLRRACDREVQRQGAHSERARARWIRHIYGEHDYPIVLARLVGCDDVVRSLTTREGMREGSAGLRPQRIHLRFAEPIDSVKPAGVAASEWEGHGERTDPDLAGDGVSRVIGNAGRRPVPGVESAGRARGRRAVKAAMEWVTQGNRTVTSKYSELAVAYY